ncbi:MAG: hypothetical protein A3E78_04660 [Alphaproteobacteria bacterium RIFCSPHIGHO2_12_FULL_63_12]|nr:MAG: hypothetical protein A3E78_04660 [Alphaproteobacteria bacterium RIFCSPHIGHO2_12_FULL_63_12]
MSEGAPVESSLTDVLAVFFGGGPRDYAEIESSVLSVGCAVLDDVSVIDFMVPKSKVPIEDITAWTSGFSNAPFLVLSRASTLHPSERDRVVVFRTRRVWLTEIYEQDLYEWTTNFCGHDAAGKKEESGGHYSWLWTWDTDDKTVLQDGFRLYVAGPDNMMLLERISSVVE